MGEQRPHSGEVATQLPGLEAPKGTCSLPKCSDPATTILRAKPSGLIPNERVDFGFCADHAAQYERGGYERV